MKPVRRSAEAGVELAETAGFYDERQVGLGAAFISEFVNATELVQQFPSLGRPIGNRMRRVLTNRFPHAIKKGFIILEDVTIGVCDRCGNRYYGAAILHAVHELSTGRRSPAKTEAIAVAHLHPV